MSGWDDFIKEINSGKGQQQANTPPAAPSAASTGTQSSATGWDDFMKRINGESAPAAEPQTTVLPEQTSAQTEPFQLRMAKQQATENEIRRRVQEAIGGIAESSVKDTQQKRANQAAADKNFKSNLWNMLGLAAQSAQQAQSGAQLPVQQQIDQAQRQAQAGAALAEAKRRSDEAAAAFDKQNILERQGHELSGWGQRTVGNLGNTLLTIGDAYNQADARMQAYDPNNMLISQMLGQDPVKEAERQVEARTGEEARAAIDKAYSSVDRIAERGNEELQRAKDGASALGRLGLDLETGALDLGADALTNAVAPGAGMAAMGARVFGEAAREERQKGGDLGRQMLAGTKAAAIEVLTEKISGPFEKIYGKSFAGKAINKALDAIDSKSGRMAINLLTDALGEGAEEILSDVLNPVADRALGLADSWDEAWSETTVEGVLYDGLVGFLLGMAGSAGKIMQTKGTITPEDIQQIKADGQAAAEQAMREAAPKPDAETTPQETVESPASEGDIVTPTEAETAPTVESAPTQPQVQPRVPAKDFTPKPTTKWNPKSQRGKNEIKAARQLRRDLGLWNSSAEAAEAVHRVAESMRDRNRGTDVMDVARKAVDEMLQKQKSGVESGDRELYNKIRQYLNGTDIQISDELRGDITDFSAWKKNAMKKLRLRANSGQSIDSIYAELGQIAGEGVFPPDVYAHSDMIARILHTLDTLKPQAIMMSEEFTGEAYDAIRDGLAEDLARAAAATVGGKWKGYTPGESMGGKSEAAIRHEAIELEMDVAAMDGNDLSREEAARIVDERYIKYGVYNEAEVMAMEETEGTENGTDETGEETETAPGDAAAETERTADTGAAEDGGTGVYGVVGRDVPAQQQTGDVTEQNRQRERLPREVERGFSENVRTDANMEQEIRDDFTADPEYYTQLANKDTLGKAQAIYGRGIDEARATVDRAIEAAKSGRKLAPEMVPLARMVANELSRNGDKNAARRILSDIAVELTQAGQLGQAAKILRGTDPETALRAVQKALDKINAERQKRFGNKNKWTAELTEEERAMLEGIDIGDEAAYQAAYKQIAERLGREMPATLWEKLTELRRINMLLRPRTQIKNVAANVPMIGLRKGAETLSGAIQDALVKTGAMDKAEQTRTLKVGKEYRDAAKNYFAENKDSILSEGNKWDINSMLREQRTYFKDGALTRALSKLTGKEQQNLLEQARRFTYDLLEKGDAPFVRSAYIDSLAQYMAAQGITDFNNIPAEATDFALANAMEATFKDANVIATFINQVKKNGGAVGAALDVLFPFTTTPLNITSLMMKYSPAGFGSAIYDAVKGRATTAQIVDKASKATVGSVVFGLGILLRSMGAITGRADDDKDKAALDKATGKSPYSIGGRWSYDWAQPVGSLLALGAEAWDAAQGQDGMADALMHALYSAGDSVLNMSLFQNVTSILGGYGSNTEKVLDSIIEGGASQFIPGLAGDIAKLIDGTVRSTYTGGNTWQDALARMGVNIPGLSKTMPANVNVKGEENTRGGFLLRSFETLVDPGTINKNQMDEADRAIYDLYERTGDKTIFPSVSPYSFDHGGETYRMTGEERETFQTTQGQLYYDMLESLMDSGDWDSMSDKAKVKLLQDARAYALDEAKRELVEARGGEYESGNWEQVSGLADGDADTAAQYLSVRDAATTAIKGKDYDVLDQLLGDGGAYHDLGEDAQDMLFSSIDGLKRLVSMRGDGVSAENAMKAFDAIKGLKTQDEQTAAIVGLDGMSDADKIKVLKACTSEEYAEKVKTAYDSGVSLGEWSRVYAARQRINKGEGTAQNKATDFAAWLDKNTNLTAAQKDVVQDQLSFYSMNKAEPTHYDGLRESKVNEDTARRIANAMTMIQPLEGKTQATQEQKVDTILGMGLSDGDTWAALKEYTSPAYYNKAAEAYRKGIDLDDYVRQFREADLPNDKGETNGQLSQDELWKYYKANPGNETFVKVMWMIGGFKTDWDTYKRKQR